jgi:hypothetical protein
MIEAKATIRADRFLRSFQRFSENSKRTKQQLLTQQMRLLVRDVVGVTPPGDRKKGEGAIAVDLLRIFRPMNDAQLAAFENFNGLERREQFGHRGAKALGEIRTVILSRGEMEQWHQRRRRRDGRVMQIHRRVTTGLRKRDLKGLDTGLVRERDFAWYRRKVQNEVGTLAAGWNAAAQKLGVRLPAWVRRHGASRGSITITITATSMRIRVVNAVPFGPNVRGLIGRINWALNNRARQMDKQVRHFALKEEARRAGLVMR